MWTDIGTRKWCTDCRSRQTVVDQFEDGHYESWGEQAYKVTLFDCGHSEQTTPRTIGPAPGAPYAGPNVAVSPTASAVDLARTRMRDPFLACEVDG